jgi:hypothetical protein
MGDHGMDFLYVLGPIRRNTGHVTIVRRLQFRIMSPIGSERHSKHFEFDSPKPSEATILPKDALFLLGKSVLRFLCRQPLNICHFP